MFYSCKLPHFFYFGSYQLVTTLDILKNESPWTLCLLSILQLKDTKDEVLYTTLWSTFITLKMDDNVGLHTITSSSSLIVLGSYMISFNFFFKKNIIKAAFSQNIQFECFISLLVQNKYLFAELIGAISKFSMESYGKMMDNRHKYIKLNWTHNSLTVINHWKTNRKVG